MSGPHEHPHRRAVHGNIGRLNSSAWATNFRRSTRTPGASLKCRRAGQAPSSPATRNHCLPPRHLGCSINCVPPYVCGTTRFVPSQLMWIGRGASSCLMRSAIRPRWALRRCRLSCPIWPPTGAYRRPRRIKPSPRCCFSTGPFSVCSCRGSTRWWPRTSSLGFRWCSRPPKCAPCCTR